MNIPLGSSSCPLFSGWIFRLLVFEEGGKPEDPEQNPRSEDGNQQPSQSRSTQSIRPTVVSRPNAVDSYPSLSRFAPKPIYWSIRTQIVDWFIHLFEILHVLAQAKTDILTRKVYCLWFTYLFSWLDYKVYLSQNQFSVSQLEVIK